MDPKRLQDRLAAKIDMLGIKRYDEQGHVSTLTGGKLEWTGAEMMERIIAAQRMRTYIDEAIESMTAAFWGPEQNQTFERISYVIMDEATLGRDYAEYHQNAYEPALGDQRGHPGVWHPRRKDATVYPTRDSAQRRANALAEIEPSRKPVVLRLPSLDIVPPEVTGAELARAMWPPRHSAADNGKRWVVKDLYTGRYIKLDGESPILWADECDDATIFTDRALAEKYSQDYSNSHARATVIDAATVFGD